MAIDLIKGEQYAITGGNQQGGFLDVGGIVGKAAKEVVDIQEKERAKIDAIVAKRMAKADAANRKIASSLNKMKSGADIEGLNADQNKVIKDYLVEQKNQYVEAANMLATMQPGDPGYTDYVDVMNQVNQNITNVSNNMKTYKLNQKDLYEDFQENLLSAGDPTRLSQAAYIYHPDTSFSLNKKGGLMFNLDGQEIDYANFNPPSAKATSTATALLKLTDQVYNKAFKSGQAANQYSSANLRMQIEDAIGSNPDIAKSLVMDGLLTNTPLKISEASFKDPTTLKNDLVDQIMNGIMAASDAGAKDYAIKNRNTNDGDNKSKLQYNIEVLKAIKGGAKGVKTKLYDSITGTKSFEPSEIIYDSTGYYIFDKNGNKLVIINENGALGKDAQRFGVTSLDQLK
jgi:hypothetical protein